MQVIGIQLTGFKYFYLTLIILFNNNHDFCVEESPGDVVANELDCDIVEREFRL